MFLHLPAAVNQTAVSRLVRWSAPGVLFLATMLLAACGSNGEPTGDVSPLGYTPGSNAYTIDVDGASREFIVHVPDSYTPGTPVPLVIMFHGTSQSGPYMEQNSGWVERADEEGFIAIFPTALKYSFVNENREQTRWTAYNIRTSVGPDADVKDDVAFVEALLELVTATWDIDAQRIYATGFSNGGAFVATRLMMEMADVFASFAVAGSGIIRAENFEPGADTPKRSYYVVIGTKDPKLFESIFEATGRSRIPSDPETLLATPLRDRILGPLTPLELEPEYTVQTAGTSTLMTFDQSSSGGSNEMRLLIVDGMAHIYPHEGNSDRFGFTAAELFWEFFLEHSMP